MVHIPQQNRIDERKNYIIVKRISLISIAYKLLVNL